MLQPVNMEGHGGVSSVRIDRESGGIVYPCPWTYRVIGREREVVREAVERLLAGREFLLTAARASSGGKYQSWNIEVVVRDEEERNALFCRFKEHPAVVLVL